MSIREGCRAMLWSDISRAGRAGFTSRALLLLLLVLCAGIGQAQTAVDDPLFGPWYGSGYLPVSGTRSNVLPANAGAEGMQNWLSVGDWRVQGPFPSREWNAATPALPTKFEFNTIATDLDLTRAPVWESAGLADDNGMFWPPAWDFKSKKYQAKPDPRRNAGMQKAYFYATTIIHAEKEGELWAAVGADDRAKVWVNDKLGGQSPAVAPDAQTVTPAVVFANGAPQKGAGSSIVTRPNSEDLLMFRVSFVKGPNRVVVCCQNDEGLTYFWMRICVRGRPLPVAAAAAKAKAMVQRIAAPRTAIMGFRNDSRNSYPDAKPVTTWDWEKGSNIRWRVPLFLPSKASPIIAGDKVFTLLDPGVLVCLDKQTGKVLWERESSRVELTDKALYEESKGLFSTYRAARDRVLALGSEEGARLAALKAQGLSEEAAQAKLREMGDAASLAAAAWRTFAFTAGKAIKWGWSDWAGYSMGTPVTDGRHVWVKYATGVAACYDLNGKQEWMTAIDPVGHWHVATSPILVGDPAAGRGRGLFVMRLPVDFLGETGKVKPTTTHALLALDAATGAVAWHTAPLKGTCDAASPVAVRLSNGETDMDVILTQAGTVLRAEDGKVLISGLFTDSDTSTATVAGDVVCQAGGGARVTAYRFIMLDRDTVGAKLLWTRQTASGFAFPAGLALHKGLLYGISGPQDCRSFEVYDARTGFPIPRKTLLAATLHGRPFVPTVCAGEYVFSTENGIPFSGKKTHAECWVMKLYPDGEIVGTNKFEKALVASPVFEGDRMYVRSDSFLTCIAPPGGKP